MRAADLPPVRSVRRSLWSVLLLVWAVALAVLLVTGDLAHYLAARNRVLVAFGAAALAVMAVLQWRRSKVPHRSDNGDDDMLHDLHCHCRRRESPGGADLLSAALVLTPLVILAVVPAGVLGASAARSRGVSALPVRAAPKVATAAPAPATTGAAAPGSTPATTAPAAAPADLTVLDVVYSVTSPDYAAKVGLHPGSHVKLEGLVVKGALGAPADGFLLTRFIITCCVADAVPVGVRVAGPGAAAVADNTWVTVAGTLDWTPQAGLRRADQALADLALDTVTVTPEPADVYLY